MFCTPPQLVRISVHRRRRRDQCGVHPLSRVRSSDGHVHVESFVVVGPTGNNTEDGFGLWRRKEWDDTFDQPQSAAFEASLSGFSWEQCAVSVAEVRNCIIGDASVFAVSAHQLSQRGTLERRRQQRSPSMPCHTGDTVAGAPLHYRKRQKQTAQNGTRAERWQPTSHRCR